MDSYMCLLVQKSESTNWRGRRFSSHEFTEVAVTHEVDRDTPHATAIICIELFEVKFVTIMLLLSSGHFSSKSDLTHSSSLIRPTKEDYSTPKYRCIRRAVYRQLLLTVSKRKLFKLCLILNGSEST